MQPRTILTPLLSLSLWLFVFSMPPIAQGYWFQTESPLVMLYTLCTLMLGGLLWASKKQPARIKRILGHPIVLLPFGIALLSAILAPFTPHPMNSFFGADEIGQGIFWYLSFGVISATTLYLLPRRGFKKLMGIQALLVAGIVTFLVCFGFELHIGKPYYFNDYAAFFGIFLLPILYAAWPTRRPTRLLAYFLIAFIPIAASTNKAAILFWWGSGVITLLLYQFTKKRRLSLQRRTSLAVVCLAPVLLWGIISYAGEHFVRGHYESLWSRYNLGKVVLTNIAHHPERALVGEGWGAYTDVIVRELDYGKWTLYDNPHTDESYWEFIFHRNPIHSHNDLLEALMSIGVLGMCLVWGLYALYPACAGRRMQPIAMLTGLAAISLTTVWFQTPISLPMMAVALAMLTRAPTVQWRFISLPMWRFVVPILALGLLWGDYEQSWTIWHNRDYIPPAIYDSASAAQCGQGMVNFKRGGHLLALHHREYQSLVKRQSEVVVEDPAHLARMQYLQCVVDRQWENNPTPRLMVADLVTYSDWAYYASQHPEAALPAHIFDGWDAKIRHWLAVMPHQTYITAPYFLWKIQHNQEDEIMDLLYDILEANPDDTVALWFTGIHMLGYPKSQYAGAYRMQRALDMGIERIMPVSPALKEELLDMS